VPAAGLLAALIVSSWSVAGTAAAAPSGHHQDPSPARHRVIHADPVAGPAQKIRPSGTVAGDRRGSVSLRALARQARPARPARRAASVPRATPHAVRTTSPTFTLNTPGVTEDSGAGGFLAADATVATNGSQIFEVTGAFVQVYSNSGAVQCGGGITLNRLLRAGGDAVSEPRVQYDPVNGRFSLIADILDQPSGAAPALYLATSDTSDPCGTWFTYRLTFSGGPFGAGQIFDFPTFGQDARALLVGLSEGSPDDSGPSDFSVFAVPKSAAYSHATLSFPAFTPDSGANIAPAVSTGNPLVGTSSTYFLSTTPGHYKLYRMDGSGSGSPSLTEQASFGADYDVPSRAPQPGTGDTLDALDGRIQSAPVWDGARLWFAQVVSASDVSTGIRYGFVTPASNGLQFATVRHSTTSADFNPAIGVGLAPNGSESIFLNWVFTDPTFGFPATMTVATMAYDGGSPINLLAVDTTYGTGSVSHSNGLRFGEYASVGIDPAVGNGTCAVIANEDFAFSGIWQTQVARLCGPSQVAVPDVINSTVQAAREALQAVSLRGDTLVSSTACPVSSHGLVIGASPPPGSMADIGSQVVLTVCNQNVSVPNVIGLDQSDARDFITDAGLTVGKISRDNRCIDVAGTVVAQNPGPGSLALRGSPVGLTVSTGTTSSGRPCVFQ
jgi:hypothetical protein